MDRVTSRVAVCVSAVSLWLVAPVSAQEALTWVDLRGDRSESCASLFEMWENEPDCAKLTALARLLPDKLRACAPGDAELDGAVVSIAGFVHPLEFEFKGVQDFLLIPRLRQDCRHPPTPLPDQVILVRYEAGVDVSADPIRVEGVLGVQFSETDNADAAYVLEATEVEAAFLPDVVE